GLAHLTPQAPRLRGPDRISTPAGAPGGYVGARQPANPHLGEGGGDLGHHVTAGRRRGDTCEPGPSKGRSDGSRSPVANMSSIDSSRPLPMTVPTLRQARERAWPQSPHCRTCPPPATETVLRRDRPTAQTGRMSTPDDQTSLLRRSMPFAGVLGIE